MQRLNAAKMNGFDIEEFFVGKAEEVLQRIRGKMESMQTRSSLTHQERDATVNCEKQW